MENLFHRCHGAQQTLTNLLGAHLLLFIYVNI